MQMPDRKQSSVCPWEATQQAISMHPLRNSQHLEIALQSCQSWDRSAVHAHQDQVVQVWPSSPV